MLKILLASEEAGLKNLRPTVLHLITGLETGGSERMLVRLVARSDPNRFQSVVVSMIDGGGTLATTLDEIGAEYRTLGMLRGVPDPRGAIRLGRILDEVRPAIVQTWLYHADFLGLIARHLGRISHLVWNIRCSDLPAIDLSGGTALIRRILSRCSAIPDAVIVNSRAGQRFHKGIGYRPRRWEFIPNGFDVAEFRPDRDGRCRFRSGLGIGEDAVVIGLPARFHPMKDHSTFLAAARQLAVRRPEARFVLVGTRVDPTNRTLAKVVAELGIDNRVILLGERNDMAALYSALDIASLSSAYGEGFPNVLGEAMACGVPCVATDTGDTNLIIGRRGLVVPPRNPEALAAAWDQLIELGAEARRSMGIQARERIIRHYNLDSVVARYEALYGELLGAHIEREVVSV